MKNLIKTIYAALIMTVFWIGLIGVDLANAQATSANYALTCGTPVGGGGSSSAANYGAVGSVLVPGGGIATSTNYSIAGGTTAITFGMGAFTAGYAGNAIETVTSATRQLKVGYIGGQGTISGTCYYRLGGAISYQSATMQAGTGDTLVHTVQASDLGVRGLEFYFVLTASEGGSIQIGSNANPYIFITELTNAQAQRPEAIPATQWRIIGVPLDIIGSTDDAVVFGDDITAEYKYHWRLGSYVPFSSPAEYNEYPAAAAATPGQGYWLIMRSPVSYGAACHSLRPNNFDFAIDYYEVPLDSGWNQLANPFPFNIDWPSVAFLHADTMVSGHHADILEDFAYVWNGTTYNSVSSLNDWDGFFVFIKKPDVTALFPYREAGAAAAKPLNQLAETPTADNWSLCFKMEVEGLTDDGNFIGVRKDAKVGDDNYDLSEPPAAPDAPRLAFRLPEGDPRPRRADFRPPFTDGAEWDLRITPATGRVLTVTGISNLPTGMEALLIPDNGIHIRLSEGQRVTLAESMASARLFVGTANYLASEAPAPVPANFALHQNYPNPFNPFTSISFALAESRHVTLEVYNIIGQRVKTLVDEEMEAGDYIKQWYGKDERGEPVASGIYFYRLKAGKFIQCRKMLLLK